MKTSINGLVIGRDLLEEREILNKAAACKGLDVQSSDKFSTYCEEVISCKLDDRLIQALKNNGFKYRSVPFVSCYLCDIEQQKEVENSNSSNSYLLFDPEQEEELDNGCGFCWYFEKQGQDFDRIVQISVILQIAPKKDGILFIPRLMGTDVISTVWHKSNIRFFKVLFENDSNNTTFPSVLKEIYTAAEGFLFVPWQEFNLGGVCSISKLFEELVQGKSAIKQLAQGGKVFKPHPYSPNNFFVVETARQKLIELWHQQLANYRRRLVF